MDGTLEQSAHTNDQTLTGHTFFVVFFVLFCFFV